MIRFLHCIVHPYKYPVLINVNLIETVVPADVEGFSIIYVSDDVIKVEQPFEQVCENILKLTSQ